MNKPTTLEWRDWANKTDINKGQEVPRINLNLQTEVAQYLVQQGQAKEGGGGEVAQTSICSFYFSFINAKEKLPTKKSMQIIRTKQKELCYTTTKQTLECPKVSINLLGRKACIRDKSTTLAWWS